MPEPVPGEVIVLDFGDQHGLERMPLTYAVTELSLNLARLSARKSSRLDRAIHYRGKFLAIGCPERRRTNEV